MPSTYTLNNGIELIATGEQTGTWSDTTNLNLQIVDRGLDGQVTVTLGSAGTSGSPNTLAITDGVLSDGQNRMIIYTDGGDLGATAYVQLTPSDAEKILYIRNSLSASRSLIVFQGTHNASNDYEIPAGTTAVVFFDGAGAGAVAANVFNNAYFDSLRLGGVSVTAILDEDNMASDSATALATQQSIKAYVDAQVTAQDLDFAGGAGTGAVDLDSQTFTIAGTSNEIDTTASGQTLTVGISDDPVLPGTGAVTLPGGTTAQRPSGTIGQIRWNSDEGTFEGYITGWGPIGGGGGFFRGENGAVGDPSTGPGDIFRINEQTLNTNTTIGATENASCTGPLAIASGVTLTVTSGGNLSIV